MEQTIKKWSLLTAMVATLGGGFVKGMELSDAIRMYDVEAGTTAIGNGADVGAMWRGLLFATYHIHSEQDLKHFRMMVQAAIACGMKPDKDSMMVLLWTGDPKIVTWAMNSCDYDINTVMDSFSRGTMLHWAVILKKLAVVIFLVNKGADITIKNSDQQTPLDVDTSPEISNYLKNSYKKDAQLCLTLAKTVLKNPEFWLDACFSHFVGNRYEQRDEFEIAVDDYVDGKNLTADQKRVVNRSKNIWMQKKKMAKTIIPNIYALSAVLKNTQSKSGLTKKRPLFTDFKIVVSGESWSPKEIGL